MPLAFNNKSKYDQMRDILHDTNVNSNTCRIVYICGLLIASFFLHLYT